MDIILTLCSIELALVLPVAVAVVFGEEVGAWLGRKAGAL